MTDPQIALREITEENREAVLSLCVDPSQGQIVAGVAHAIDEAAVTPQASPWYRAIYAGDMPELDGTEIGLELDLVRR